MLKTTRNGIELQQGRIALAERPLLEYLHSLYKYCKYTGDLLTNMCTDYYLFRVNKRY